MSSQSSRSYLAIASAIVLAGVLISASLFYAVEATKTTTTTETTTSTSTLTVTTNEFTNLLTNNTGSPCDTKFTNGLSLQAGDWSGNGSYPHQMRAFLMPANSSARICISYQVLGSRYLTLGSLNISFSGQVLSLNVTYSKYGGGGYYVNSDNPALGIGETASPSSFAYRNGTDVTNVTVVYTITTATGTAGIYALGYEGRCPPWIPLSVGYNSTEAGRLIKTDYPIFLFPSGCMANTPLSIPVIVGVSGMDVTWVNSS